MVCACHRLLMARTNHTLPTDFSTQLKSTVCACVCEVLHVHSSDSSIVKTGQLNGSETLLRQLISPVNLEN